MLWRIYITLKGTHRTYPKLIIIDDVCYIPCECKIIQYLLEQVQLLVVDDRISPFIKVATPCRRSGIAQLR